MPCVLPQPPPQAPDAVLSSSSGGSWGVLRPSPSDGLGTAQGGCAGVLFAFS